MRLRLCGSFGRSCAHLSISNTAAHPPQDGVATTEAEKALLEYAQGDVTKPETLPGAIKGASAVVFASSASRKGGNAEAVDYKGVENIARCVD